MDEALLQVLLNKVFKGFKLRLGQGIKLNHWKLGICNQVDGTIIGLMWWELLGLFLPKMPAKSMIFKGRSKDKAGDFSAAHM